MRKTHGWMFGAVAATLGAFLIVAPAQSQKPPVKVPLAQAIAKKTKVDEADVIKVLEALGPAIREKLSSGDTIELPGLGTMRVVRIPEHKDMVKGRPTTIEAVNSVEFVPVGELVDASNSPTAVPAVTVPQFEYNPLPGQTPGQKSPGVRAPNVRTP
jgi:nucleoid DNA-binding protein